MGEIKYPTRCQIVDVAGMKKFGMDLQTPGKSKPHIGKTGIAEKLADGPVKITLDDGGIIFGYECWWEPLQENSS